MYGLFYAHEPPGRGLGPIQGGGGGWRSRWIKELNHPAQAAPDHYKIYKKWRGNCKVHNMRLRCQTTQQIPALFGLYTLPVLVATLSLLQCHGYNQWCSFKNPQTFFYKPIVTFGPSENNRNTGSLSGPSQSGGKYIFFFISAWIASSETYRYKTVYSPLSKTFFKLRLLSWSASLDIASPVNMLLF